MIFDVGLHLGSLIAIIFFFRNDLLKIKNNKKLLKLIIIGSLPLIIFGYYLISFGIINILRNIELLIKDKIKIKTKKSSTRIFKLCSK